MKPSVRLSFAAAMMALLASPPLLAQPAGAPAAGAPAAGRGGAPAETWWSEKTKPAIYTAPNKPLWKPTFSKRVR